MESSNFPVGPPNLTGRPGVPAPGHTSPGFHALPASPPAILTGNPNAWSLFAAFQRRWRLAVSLGLLLGIVTAVVTWYLTVPYTYTAVTVLHVDLQKPRVMFDTLDQRSDLATYQQSQVSEIRSRRVVSAALRDPEVQRLEFVKQQADQIDWLQGQLRVDYSMGPEHLSIRINGKDEDGLKTLVGSVRKAYLDEVVGSEVKQRQQRLKDLKGLYARFKVELDEKKTLLSKLAKRIEVVRGNPQMLAQTHEFRLKEKNEITKELMGIRAELRRMKVDAPIGDGVASTAAVVGAAGAAKIVKAAPPVPVSLEALVEEQIQRDPGVIANQNEIADLQKKLDQFQERAGNPAAEPRFAIAKKALEDARKGLDSQREKLRVKLNNQLRDHWQQDLRHQQAMHEEKRTRLENLELLLNQQIDDMADGLKDFGNTANEMQDIADEIKRVENMADKVGTEVAALGVEIDAPPRVTKADDPFLIRREGIALKTAPLAGLAGFFLAALGVAFLEFRARRVNEVGDISRGLHLRVVGTLPLVQTRGVQTPAKADHAANLRQQVLLESVDSARTMILHEFRRRNLRVVMVTSAGPGEGKTVLSAHLAASLARAGWRVLLVDGDLRRPSLHKLFGFEPKAGLGEALRDDASIREVVQPGPAAGLWVIPAGCGDSQSLRALAQGRLTSLLEEIKDDFDFIILDSAPVLPVADAQLMSQAVDGVILSVLQNVSRLPFVYAAYERLALLHENLIGAVIHGSSVGIYDTKYTYLSLPSSQADASKKAE